MSDPNNAESWVSLRQEVIKAVRKRLKETSDGKTLSRYRHVHDKYPINEDTRMARKNKENWEVTWAWEKCIPTPENAEEKPIWSYDCIGFVRSIIAEVSFYNDAIETTKQIVGDMQLHGKAMAWYGAKNPTSRDGKQEFLDWIRNQPYLLNNNGEDESLIADAKNQSNFRRIRPKKLLQNFTLLPGDIIATPNHTMIFVEWMKFPDDKRVKPINKEGFHLVQERIAKISDCTQMWKSNIWDSRKEGEHKFIPQIEEAQKKGQFEGGHGYAHVIICYAQRTHNDESGHFYFYHKGKEDYKFVEDKKTNCFEAVRMGCLQ